MGFKTGAVDFILEIVIVIFIFISKFGWWNRSFNFKWRITILIIITGILLFIIEVWFFLRVNVLLPSFGKILLPLIVMALAGSDCHVG